MGWETEDAEDKLKSIGEQLTSPSRSKEWIMLSNAFDKMGKQEFNMWFNAIRANHPDFFNEGDDDDDPES